MTVYKTHRDVRWTKVLFHKPDLDTTLTALIAGVNRSSNPVPCIAAGSDDDLYSMDILCVEAGGSGLVSFHNFDHHDPELHLQPACQQAFVHFGCRSSSLENLVRYVCIVDEAKNCKIRFPTLSNIFSGMLLATPDSVEQLFRGIEILNTLLIRNLNPFDSMPDIPEWQIYIEAKAENQRHLERDFQNIVFFKTHSGNRGGLLVTTAIGGMSLLYRGGCEVGILYNPVKNKFTIASKKHNLSCLLKSFQNHEPGWGGRAQIFGSPYGGTLFTVDDVLSLVSEVL
jgi:hypothetical protein